MSVYLPVSVCLPEEDVSPSINDDDDRRTELSDSLYKATVDPLLFALLLGVVSAQVSLLIAGAAALASTLFMLWLARLHPQHAE